MNATLTCPSFENDHKPVIDKYDFKEFLAPISDFEAYMIEQFSRTGAKAKKESTLKLHRVSESMHKLFNSDEVICYLSWAKKQGYFVTLMAPQNIEAGSFEEEVLSILYKGATVTNEYIIEIPYTSL